MKRMLEKTEQVRSALDIEHLNGLAVLQLMESDSPAIAEKWEDLAGEEFDESGIYSPDEVGLGNWFASGFDD